MARSVTGVMGDSHLVEGRFSAQIVGINDMRAVAEVARALPLMFAGAPDMTDIADLLEAVDGVLLTGAKANVHRARFGAAAQAGPEPYDQDRDGVALPLVEACVARGVPLLGICRGLQEMNVAFGGPLHPEKGSPRTAPSRRSRSLAFALGVQWHAEYDPQFNPINRALFQAFGEAVGARARRSRGR